jgi:hypothetical protein
MLFAVLSLQLFKWRPAEHSCPAKNQYRKFETNVPTKGIARPQSQFPHSCVCERFIHYHTALPIFLQEICGPIMGIYV